MRQPEARGARLLVLLPGLLASWVLLGAHGPGQALVVAAFVGALTIAFATDARPVPVALLVPTADARTRQRLQAPTPYWCAVEVAHRRRQPRAPGQR